MKLKKHKLTAEHTEMEACSEKYFSVVFVLSVVRKDFLRVR